MAIIYFHERRDGRQAPYADQTNKKSRYHSETFFDYLKLN
jgi:hypothetical protein